ncbi:MAG: LysR family transcriptional regulator [Rhizobiaceae bacterium]
MLAMQKSNLANLDLNLLVSLEVLLEECHVTKAAERLNMSQPTMSRTLARLRQMFNDPLLVQSPDGYLKTPRAEGLAPRVSSALSAIQLAIANPVFEPADESGKFRICTRDYGEVLVLPTLLKRLSEAAPKLKLEVIPASIYSMTKVQDGTADASLGIIPDGARKNCVVEPLFEDRFVCVMSKSHPNAGQPLTAELFSSYNHSAVDTASRPNIGIEEEVLPNGLRRNVVKRSPYFLSSLFSISQTELVQIAPFRFVEPMLEPLKLTTKELPFETEPLRYCLAWHVRNSETPSHRWVRDQIIKAARTVCAE